MPVHIRPDAYAACHSLHRFHLLRGIQPKRMEPKKMGNNGNSMAGYDKRIGMGDELNANGKDQLMGEETKTRNSISLPRGIVMLCAVAILCVIADLIGGLIEYFQNDTLRIVRIIIRCFTILGWSAVEWYIVSELWETRKKRKTP